MTLIQLHEQIADGTYLSSEEADAILPYIDDGQEVVYTVRRGRELNATCLSMCRAGDNILVRGSYFVGVDWVEQGKVAIQVNPKMNDGFEVDYVRMLNEALSEPDNYEHLRDLVTIDFNKPAIKIRQQRDVLSVFLVTEYINMLQRIVRNGLKKSFYLVEENLRSKAKGRLMVGRNIRQNLTKGRITANVCKYQVYDIDTPENRILKKALMFCLKQLEAFVQVAEGKSFSKAAKELFLTQPTISAHIASLERELNARLFVRNTKEVSLSEDGKDLYRYAKQIIDLQKQIEERFETEEEGSRHCITIAASTIPAQYLLPRVLKRFNEKYPDEQIKIMESDSSKVVSQIVDHIVDVGFTGTVLEKKHCRYLPFYKDKLAVITPNTERYRRLKEESPDGIDWILEEHLIMREEGSGTRKEAEEQLKAAGIPAEKLDVIASIGNQETIKKSVRQGMGITILSELAAVDEEADGELLTFPIPGADAGRDINLVYNKNYQLSRSAERFIKVVKEVYLRESVN